MGALRQPLGPDPDQAERWLHDELQRPEYHRETLLERLLHWLFDQLDRLSESATHASALSTFVALLVGVCLVAVLGYALSRVRGVGRARREGQAPVVVHEVTAAELRERARRALGEQRWSDAAADAFRALATSMVERDVVAHSLGTTAHELGEGIAARFPDHATRVRRAADLFDALVYGDRRGRREDAVGVLDLDQELLHARPAEARDRRDRLTVPR